MESPYISVQGETVMRRCIFQDQLICVLDVLIRGIVAIRMARVGEGDESQSISVAQKWIASMWNARRVEADGLGLASSS